MPLQRIVLIANPRAGRVRGPVMEKIVALLDAAVPTTLAWTSHPGHATTLAATHGADRDTLVAIVGGDGSLNESLQRLPEQAVLGLIPAGTANVAARELGIPLEPLEAAKLLLTGQVARLDLGHVMPLARAGGDRYVPVSERGPRRFLVMAGVGFDAHVAGRVPSFTKKILRKYAYHLQSVLEYPFYRPPRLECCQTDGPVARCETEVSCGRSWAHGVLPAAGADGPVFRGVFAQFANMRRYGGDLFFAPNARWDDGALDLVLVHDLRLPTLLAVVAGAMARRGAPPRLSRHQRLRACRCVALDGPVPYQLDGEVFPAEDALDISVTPGGLQMVIP